MGDSCYPFHQLMVQSLGLINNNLSLSWKDKKKDTFDYSRGDSFISNSRLLPPAVKITPKKMFYVVKFERGVAKAPSFIPESEFNLHGWELAFPCEPEIEQLSSGRKFNTVMRKLKIASHDRDKFRLGQFRFKLGTEYDHEVSKDGQGHGGHDTLALTELLNSSWLEHRDDMVNVFGYSLITSRRQTTPLARLSFPVYDMQLGTYQGIGIAAAAWCYLDPEVPPMSELQSTGLIDDTGARSATLCISHTQFWDDWFMKIVASLPLNLVFRLGSPFSVGHELAKAVDAEPWWSSRRDRMIPPEYRWWARHCDPDSLEFNWEWDQRSSPEYYHKEVHNRLHMTYPKGQVFNIQGEQSVVTVGSHFTRHGAWPYIDYKWNFTFNWEMNFTLRAVNDGGLEIISEIKVNTEQTDYYGLSPSEGWKQCIDSMTEHVKGVLENLKKAVFNDLDESLKNQQMMHLPGEGLFLLSDPTFNHRGDLLANLTWNGKVAAAENGENLANLSDEEDIWEPDLSSVAHLPARQQRYVLDDSVPSVFHAVALGDLHSTLLEVDEHVAEAQRKGDQEMIQTEVTKANQEVPSQKPAGEDL